MTTDPYPANGQHFSRAIVSVLVSLVLACPSRPAVAAFETAIQVAQPLWTEDNIVISSVSYIVWLGGRAPGIEVAWTAKPNVVLREGDSQPTNRNAASLYGVAVRLKPQAAPSDTLRVVLDLTGLASRDSTWYLPQDHVVNATVECILINASRSQPLIKFVALEVEGDQRYRSIAGIRTVSHTSVPVGDRAELHGLCRGAVSKLWPRWRFPDVDTEVREWAASRKEDPTVAYGDFDDDGQEDVAFLIQPAPGSDSRRIVACLSSIGAAKPVVIKKPYCIDGIARTPKGQRYYDYSTDLEGTYPKAGISAYCFEKAGATYIFTDGSFREIVDSD